MKKIAVLTSGGDSPGINAAIRAVLKTALYKGVVPFGIFDGYLGMIEGRGKALTYTDVDNIIQYGGTVLGSARCEAFRTEEGRREAIAFLNLGWWLIKLLPILKRALSKSILRLTQVYLALLKEMYITSEERSLKNWRFILHLSFFIFHSSF